MARGLLLLAAAALWAAPTAATDGVQVLTTAGAGTILGGNMTLDVAYPAPADVLVAPVAHGPGGFALLADDTLYSADGTATPLPGADALVGAGQLRKAAALINAHLAENDAGWKLWNTLASLSRRLGRYELAVSAWRASARQLEAAEHVKHAHAALTSALRLTPADQVLRDEVSRLARLVKRVPPGPASRPTLKVPPAPRPAAPHVPAQKLASLPPNKRPAPVPVRSSAPLRRTLEIVTDPHLAIFDILDAEKQGR
jgi:hypothetical protein